MGQEARNETSTNIVLVGMMFSGKTVTARELARCQGMAWIDTDRAVENVSGMTVAEIWAVEGEAGFRRRELTVLKALRSSTGFRGVVATGGGIVELPEADRYLREVGTVFYLKTTPETLAWRAQVSHLEARDSGIDHFGSRPLISREIDEGHDALVGKFRELLSSREAKYELIADFVVDADASSPAQIAQEIVALLDGGKSVEGV